MEPRLRKAYVVGAALGLTAGALMAWFVLRPILDALHPVDEEERPPVVVSNGSVKLDSGPGLPPGKRGDFIAVNGFTLYHYVGYDESTDLTVTSLDLTVEGTTSPACQNLIPGLSEFTLLTSKGTIVVNIRPRPGSSTIKDPFFEFISNATKPKKARLRLLDNDLQGVEFKVGSTTSKCAFDKDEDERQITIQPR